MADVVLAEPRQQVFPGDSGAGVWKQYAGEAVSDADPVPRLGQDNIRH